MDTGCKEENNLSFDWDELIESKRTATILINAIRNTAE